MLFSAGSFGDNRNESIRRDLVRGFELAWTFRFERIRFEFIVMRSAETWNVLQDKRTVEVVSLIYAIRPSTKWHIGRFCSTFSQTRGPMSLNRSMLSYTVYCTVIVLL